VYLDTLVFIGGIGAQYGSEDQLSFAVGAVSASWVWFLALGYYARLLRPTFENPKAWTVLDIGIGLLMWSIALTLLL
jgi:L-lysine exporter family protein LysE/ArgO